MDDGLYTVADRLGVSLFDEAKIQERSQSVGISQQQASLSSEKAARLVRAQHEAQAEDFVEALQVHQISDDQVVASSTSIATVILLTVRDTMKSVEMALLYSIFVLAAVFHAFNGLWTFCIVWGITLSDRSQAGMRRVSTALMLGVAALGLSAIWGTYWLNLYQ
jgi:succinate dehydrogenase / fumarate reductase cytochrome b subunit